MSPQTEAPKPEFKPQWQPVPGRSEQMEELAAVDVMLASDEASCVSGATIAVTGGKPII